MYDIEGSFDQQLLGSGKHLAVLVPDKAVISDQSQKFLDDAPNMSSMEITTAGMALSHSLAMVNMKMQVATSLTQGSNKSLQTLLKNQ